MPIIFFERVRVFTVAAFVAMIAAVPASAEPSATRIVLTIHLGAENYPANRVLDSAIRAALVSQFPEPLEYFSEYLDTESFDPADARAALAGSIDRRFRSRPIDVVIAVTGQSLQFVLAHRDTLFRNAPIVYMGATAPNETVRTAARGITGVVVAAAYRETLRAALELHPSTERVFVIANSPDREAESVVRHELREFEQRVELQYLAYTSTARLVHAVKEVPRGSLVLFIWHGFQDRSNLIYSDEIARLIADASPVPVYGTSDFYIGTGVVGGIMRVTNETGKRIGMLAGEILNGTRAVDLPLEAARLVPVFDWRALQRWNIDNTRLPARAQLLFRVPTAWESYRGYIFGTVIVVVVQLVLIAGLVLQRFRRRRDEATIRAREATIRTNYERIRLLAARVINTQESTRAEIARDLHDGVCQQLAAISITLSGLKRDAGRLQDAETQQRLINLQQQMHNVYDDLRRISHDLHPSALRLLGLTAGLKSHCAELEKTHTVRVKLKPEGNLGTTPPAVSLAMFRIAQEALRNGIVHGKAQELEVRLLNWNGFLELTISDNGVGFDVETVRRAGGGLGIVSIEERARMLGGSARITSVRGHGTTVCVRAPVPDGTERLLNYA